MYILDKQLIHPYLTVIDSITVRLAPDKPGKNCNLSCPYCIAKYEYDYINDDTDEYYQNKNICDKVILALQKEVFFSPKSLERFLERNKDLKHIEVYTNGYDQKTQLEFLNKYSNLYIVRTYAETYQTDRHNLYSIINHPRVTNQLLIKPNMDLNKLINVPNRIIKFIYDENIDKQYQGSVLQKFFKENPDYLDLSIYKYGYHYHQLTNMMIHFYNNHTKPFLLFFRKDKNLVHSLSNYYNWLLNYTYEHQSRRKVLDSKVNDIKTSLMANIIKDSKYYPEIEENNIKCLNFYNNLFNLNYKKKSKNIDVIIDISYLGHIHSHYQQYTKVFNKKEIKLVFGFENLYNIKDSDLICFIFNNILDNGLYFTFIGLKYDIMKLLSNPDEYNLPDIKSNLSMEYIKRKCL